MRALCMFLLTLAGLLGPSSGDLPPPERSYKILILLPVASTSHKNTFKPIAEALAERGHKIMILTGDNKTFSKHPNVQQVSHGLPSLFNDDLNMFELRKSKSNFFGTVSEYMLSIAREIYDVPVVKELYDNRKEYDLILFMHALNEMVAPFLHEIPFAIVVPFGIDSYYSALIGNPLNPSYVVNYMQTVDLSTVWGRLANLALHVLPIVYWKKWAHVPLMQQELRTRFPHLPDLTEIEKNLSFALLNTHFSMDIPLPLLPSQIEVGGMHCRPGKPLPEDLKSWIEGAGPAGVVFFSLGSITKGETMPVQFREMFLEAFRKLEQRVVWKFEGKLDNVPENVMIKQWLPQQDILAHPNVRLFISHGGGLSTQESSYHGVPMLIIPLYGDQPKNAEHISAKGRGLSLEWEELTSDLISESVSELLRNPKYKKNMEEVSRSFRDQPQSPKDRAVFWAEYTIRNKGAPKLRSPAIDLSWIEFLLLDVLAVFFVILTVAFIIMRFLLKKVLKVIFGGLSKKKRD